MINTVIKERLKTTISNYRFNSILNKALMAIKNTYSVMNNDNLGIVCDVLSKGKVLVVDDKRLREIEARRIELSYLHNDNKINDFGAGNSKTLHTQIQMDHGVVIATTICKALRASSFKPWRQFLYKLTKALYPKNVLEMGICVGISRSYIAAAISDNGRPNSRLMTLEGSEVLAEIAQETFTCLKLPVQMKIGKFSSTLNAALRESSPLDLVFIDGHHDGEATKKYYFQILPYLSKNAVLIFDDIRWSPSITDFWRWISSDMFRVNAVIDLHSVGIVVTP